MSFTEDAISRDGFLGGRLTIRQPREGYRAATDPVFLAAFAPVRPGARVLDLGCGVGTAGLCLARRVGDIDLVGVELQPDYAELARRNAQANGIAMEVLCGDLRVPPPALRAGVFDHVIANPPFYAQAAHTGSPETGRDIANRERTASLADWIDAALRRLVPGGCLTMIQRTERLPEILIGLKGRAGNAQVLPIAARTGRPASRILIRARKATAGPMTLLSPLTVHKGNCHRVGGTDYSDLVVSVLSGSGELVPENR